MLRPPPPPQIWRGDALAGSGLGLASVQVVQPARRPSSFMTRCPGGGCCWLSPTSTPSTTGRSVGGLHVSASEPPLWQFLADRTCQALQLASVVSHLARGVDLLLLVSCQGCHLHRCSSFRRATSTPCLGSCPTGSSPAVLETAGRSDHPLELGLVEVSLCQG